MATILNVEDNPGHAFLIKRALLSISSEIDVRQVMDGQLAVDYLKQEHGFADADEAPRPDVVLLDLNLPKLNGFDVLKVIKNDSRLQSLPVVILTTSDSEQDRRLCEECRADDFMTKSGDFEELVFTLRERLKNWL
jgi:DNA-binding response OmpR family regulator